MQHIADQKGRAIQYLLRRAALKTILYTSACKDDMEELPASHQ